MDSPVVEGRGVEDTLDAVESLYAVRRSADAEMFVLAAHFADLHPAESVRAAREGGAGPVVVRGRERAVRLGGVRALRRAWIGRRSTTWTGRCRGAVPDAARAFAALRARTTDVELPLDDEEDSPGGAAGERAHRGSRCAGADGRVCATGRVPPTHLPPWLTVPAPAPEPTFAFDWSRLLPSLQLHLHLAHEDHRDDTPERGHRDRHPTNRLTRGAGSLDHRD